MILSIPILHQFLVDEGFTIQAVDSFDNERDPPHHRGSPWQAVGIQLSCSLSAAVEIIRKDATLRVWLLRDGSPMATIICTVPLADPQCFEKVLEALRGDYNVDVPSS